jgi:hypothetical protein
LDFKLNLLEVDKYVESYYFFGLEILPQATLKSHTESCNLKGITVIPLVTSFRPTQFRTNVACPKTQYTKPHGEVRTHNAENIFELLHSRDQKLTLDHPVEFRKQSAHEESVEPESDPKERNVLFLKLTEGRGFIEAGIKLFEGIEWNEH